MAQPAQCRLLQRAVLTAMPGGRARADELPALQVAVQGRQRELVLGLPAALGRPRQKGLRQGGPLACVLQAVVNPSRSPAATGPPPLRARPCLSLAAQRACPGSCARDMRRARLPGGSRLPAWCSVAPGRARGAAAGGCRRQVHLHHAVLCGCTHPAVAALGQGQGMGLT